MKLRQNESYELVNPSAEVLKSTTCCCCIPLRLGMLILLGLSIILSIIDASVGPLANSWSIWLTACVMIVVSLFAIYGVHVYQSLPCKIYFWWLTMYIVICLCIVLYEIIDWNNICDNEDEDQCNSHAWKTGFIISRVIQIILSLYFARVTHIFCGLLEQTEKMREPMLETDVAYEPPSASGNNEL